MNKLILISTILTISAAPLFASLHGEIRAGSRAYKKGNYEQALERFRNAQIAAPDSPAVGFNIGAALFKLGKLDEAAAAFAKAAAGRNPAADSQAYYNMGNTAYRQQKTDEAIEYYKKALALNPNDMDAKYNIEFLKYHKQQNKPSKDQKDQNGKQQPGDNKQDQGKGQDRQAPSPKNEEKNKQGMSKEDARRILQYFNESEQNNARHRKMAQPQLPKVEEDW